MRNYIINPLNRVYYQMNTKSFSALYFNFPVDVFYKHSNGMSLDQFWHRLFEHNKMFQYLFGDRFTAEQAVRFVENGDRWHTLERIQGYIAYDCGDMASTLPFLEVDSMFGVSLKILWDKVDMIIGSSSRKMLLDSFDLNDRFPAKCEIVNPNDIHFEMVRIDHQNSITRATKALADNEMDVPWYFRAHGKAHLKRMIRFNSDRHNMKLFANSITDSVDGNVGLKLHCGAYTQFISTKKLIKLLAERVGAKNTNIMKDILRLHLRLGTKKLDEDEFEQTSTILKNLINSLYDNL